MKTENPNMIKLLTLYQILGKLNSQTKKQKDGVCWKECSKMTSQQLNLRTHAIFRREEQMYIRDPQDQLGMNLDFSKFSHTKIEKEWRRVISVTHRILNMRDSTKSG